LPIPNRRRLLGARAANNVLLGRRVLLADRGLVASIRPRVEGPGSWLWTAGPGLLVTLVEKIHRPVLLA
ncbi:hypothetical protein ACYOEI_29185, partial [Singulisphaera rosea]